MATSVLRELEELRLMLDSPGKRVFSPMHSLKTLSTPRAPPLDAMRTYSTALNSAEKSVDRLGRAIEAAEEEMDAALQRTTEVHRSQLKQKELETLELQRVIGAKERSIDSLRDTLATTKRTYESKLAQSESALALKDTEVQIKALSEELRTSRLERDSMGLHLERAEAGRRAVEVEAREREAELGADVRAKGDEAAKALMALRYEKKDKEDWRLQSEDLRRQLQLLQDDLRMHKDDTVVIKERYEAELTETRRRCLLESEEAQRQAEAEVDGYRRRCEMELEDMRRRLRSEKNLRKACEKWLRSELKSREEMELLLAAVKDAATGRATTAGEAAKVEALIDRLRTGSPSPPLHSPTTSPRYGAGPTTHMATVTAPGPTSAGARALELDLLRRKLEEDNGRLKGELLAARKMLSERLKY
ncbi:hypothetical protein TSOC_011125 [Tetrabaena socialis]|uniref:Uncharacterized protein n=1 Tax=Tetrabaena socialis TaxID=47790 RepID=A0A2J7ZRG2_9CHLO|nr:hypothetical protein TSOC_011125 [Tetrabaena socialis]|eukprot:PNH02863.1 hypothetical protein TSOC_011125 [Tetrabaena socialis]